MNNAKNDFENAVKTLVETWLANPGTSGASALEPIIESLAFRDNASICLASFSSAFSHPDSTKILDAFNTATKYIAHFDWPEELISLHKIYDLTGRLSRTKNDADHSMTM